MTTRITRRVLASAAAGALLLPALFAAPAQAETKPVDVKSYSIKDVTFSEDGCKDVRVDIRYSATKDATDIDIYADITRNDMFVNYANFLDKATTTTARLCSDDKLGKHEIGRADIDAWMSKAPHFWDSTDFTAKTFYVRAKTKTKLSATRSGKYVTLKASATRYSHYDFEDDRYVRYSPAKAKFQVKKGSKWVTLKTVNFSKGKASLKVKQSAKKSYRVTFSQTSTTTAATSKSVSK